MNSFGVYPVFYLPPDYITPCYYLDSYTIFDTDVEDVASNDTSPEPALIGDFVKDKPMAVSKVEPKRNSCFGFF